MWSNLPKKQNLGNSARLAFEIIFSSSTDFSHWQSLHLGQISCCLVQEVAIGLLKNILAHNLKRNVILINKWMNVHLRTPQYLIYIRKMWTIWLNRSPLKILEPSDKPFWDSFEGRKFSSQNKAIGILSDKIGEPGTSGYLQTTWLDLILESKDKRHGPDRARTSDLIKKGGQNQLRQM